MHYDTSSLVIEFNGEVFKALHPDKLRVVRKHLSEIEAYRPTYRRMNMECNCGGLDYNADDRNLQRDDAGHHFLEPHGVETNPIMKHFRNKHLPPHLRGTSIAFCQMANDILGSLPGGPERTVALRKLLESKDAAVRAMVE